MGGYLARGFSSVDNLVMVSFTIWSLLTSLQERLFQQSDMDSLWDKSNFNASIVDSLHGRLCFTIFTLCMPLHS